MKKLRQIAISDARSDVGASKKHVYVELSDREKEAINKGAISSTDLNKVMSNMDKDKLREFVMPKVGNTMPASKVQMMKNYSDIGYTIAQIAEAMNLSPSTVNYYVNDLKEKSEN